jgi:hypothetical protein
MALTEHGTVEFRLFNSTVSATEIVYFVNFARGLVQAIRQKDPRLIAFLNANQNKSFLDLTTLAAHLEIDIGDPQLFASKVRRWSERLLPWRRSQHGFTQEQLDRTAYDAYESSDSSIVWPLFVGTSIGLLFYFF